MAVENDKSELSVKVCSNEHEANILAQFCGRIFRPAVEQWARFLLSGKHPTVRREHFIFVENENGETVSSLCQIPQTWRYEEVSLRVGQIELVGTDPRFRRRGLVRAQMNVFDELLRANDCALSCVQGMPGVYQRLGYEYALPLKGGVRLWLEQIPRVPETTLYRVRQAETRDIPVLASLYDADMQSVAISGERTKELWEYQETQPIASEHAYETYVIERDRAIAGYFRWLRHSKSDFVALRELSVEDYDVLLIALDFARRRARERNLSSVALQLPMSHRAVTAAMYLGAQEITPFAWQVRVVDWPLLLRQITPVLERRLKSSLLAGWTGTLAIRLIDAGMLEMRLNNGQLTGIEMTRSGVAYDVESPSGLLCQLVLGYRASNELMNWHPDFQVRASAHLLVDTLFPKRASFVYEAY